MDCLRTIITPVIYRCVAQFGILPIITARHNSTENEELSVNQRETRFINRLFEELITRVRLKIMLLREKKKSITK